MIHSKVVKSNNQMILEIDGKKTSPIAYMCYNPPKALYQQFDGHGLKIFSTSIYFTDNGINPMSLIRPFRDLVWKDEDTYDFSIVDKDFELITKDNENAYIIPRVCLDTPKWWNSKNPDQLSQDYSNQTIKQSFASDKWIEACKKNLDKLIDYIEHSKWNKNVIGYHIAFGGTEECFHPSTKPMQYQDYSEVNRQKYIDWLKEKHKDVQSLSKSWNKNITNFESICIPSPFEREASFDNVFRDTDTQRSVIDFSEYHSTIIATRGVELCKYVKEKTENNQIAGVFYGYIYQLTNGDKGHHALRTILDCPHVDFCASPFQYPDSRAALIDWPFMSATDSFGLNNKIWFAESDIRTSDSKFIKDCFKRAVPVINNYYETDIWLGPDTKKGSLNDLKKAFGRILCYQIGTWWFDMWGGWFADEYYHEFFDISTKTYTNQKAKQTTEIAVILDETSYHYMKQSNDVMFTTVVDQLAELGKSGIPYHTYEFGDFDKIPFDNYKMIMFINNASLDTEKINKINKLKDNNRTLVFSYIPDPIKSQKSVTDIKYSYKQKQENFQVVSKDNIYPAEPIADIGIVIDDKDRSLTTLGTTTTDERKGLVYKVFDNWTSVLSLAPAINHEVIRSIASMAGVHVYSYQNDIIYANSQYICIHAATGGIKRIYFPEHKKAKEIFGYINNYQNGQCIEFECKTGDTFIFELS